MVRKFEFTLYIHAILNDFHERSYHDHRTPSRLFGEVKCRRAQLVVRLVTTCEVWVMLVYFALFFRANKVKFSS